MNDWIQNYLLTALRIDKAYKASSQGWFIDTFYGPTSLQSQVDAEPVYQADKLIRQIDDLATTLATQGFGPQRTTFLSKQIQAMSVLAHRLAGAALPLEEEIRRCLDITPQWLPETDLEQALAMYDEALPGTENLRERYHSWEQRSTISSIAPKNLVHLLQQILMEVRQRTRKIIDLPEDETIEVRVVQNQPWGAANWYLGNYRSRLELNGDLPVNLFGLLYLMSHEGYPGHHTEFTLKERHLYRDQGYGEHAVFFISPQLVIAEGIASVAMDLIFTPEEAAAWAIEHLYTPFNRAVTDADLIQLYRAASISRLDDLGGNVVMLLHDGYTEQQIVDYVLQYRLESEEQIRKWIQGLQSPLMQIYAFSYAAGKQVLRPWLQGEQRIPMVKRLLTEQIYPSLLQP
ncbi:MAG: hypothetical protein KatS3mg057_1415 [Herpetosiphonaceae bacterium]|nr:MAG: hypothetical protein KatS3mg057_1415 [Herpetosiphonaceae bacterium]